MHWIKQRLAIQQTVYAMAVVATLTIAIASIQITIAYQDERDQVQQFITQLANAFSDTATRAAFHVDRAQADAVLEGLMGFENLTSASIATDLGEVLAEQTHNRERGRMDPFSRWLFGDLSRHKEILVMAKSRVPVGTLSFEVSSEEVGRSFVASLSTMLLGLVVELVVLTSALAIIFHRTLIRPLTSFADSIDAIDHDAVETPAVDVPRGHEANELGLVVLRTNELFKRLTEQRDAVLHREKIASLGSMLAGAAHELNNPLAVVMAQAQMLKENATEDTLISRADKILRPAERCAKIVRSFLEIARQRKTVKTPIEIPDVINDAIDLVSYQMQQRNVDIQISMTANIPTVAGDAMQISQAVVNLLINAQQAMLDQPPPRTIALDVKYESKSLIFTVTDNGPGIPSSMRKKALEPFFTTKSLGTGLGLPFCANVAAAYGGSLSIAEQSSGATVQLVLIVEEVDPLLPDVVVVGPLEVSLRILVVDDEQELTETFSESLALRGHQVTTETEGVSAIALLEVSTFDVVVTDIRMPDVDGIELYESVIRKYPSMRNRFVFVTGEPVSGNAELFFANHDVPCLSKPVDLNELNVAVERSSVNEVTSA